MKVFSPYDGEDEDYLHTKCEVLSKMPKPWSITWQARKDLFKEKPMKMAELSIGIVSEREASARRGVHPYISASARSLLETSCRTKVHTEWRSGSVWRWQKASVSSADRYLKQKQAHARWSYLQSL